MLGQRPRRWANIKPTLVERMLLTGLARDLELYGVISGEMTVSGKAASHSVGPD